MHILYKIISHSILTRMLQTKHYGVYFTQEIEVRKTNRDIKNNIPRNIVKLCTSESNAKKVVSFIRLSLMYQGGPVFNGGRAGCRK